MNLEKGVVNSSKYLLDPTDIGEHFLYLRYGTFYIRTGYNEIHFSPQEVAQLLEWLEQHRDLLQQTTQK